LSPQAGGGWSESFPYVLGQSVSDGLHPKGTLTLDKSGNLYGTTSESEEGSGTVFELSPPSTPGGSWTETILFQLATDGSQGTYPSGKVTFDGVGNLYATTAGGGSRNSGVVFQLEPPPTGHGSWTYRLIWDFATDDGGSPGRDLGFHSGALYGTSFEGGANGHGYVFQLVPKPGVWTQNVLYSFGASASDASFPEGRLIFDDAGNLYGTTPSGGSGACSCGTVYELSPPAVAGDPWQETILHSFTRHGDGALPYAGVTRNKNGILYGVAAGGSPQGPPPTKGEGLVFQLKPPAMPGGEWAETVLHRFTGAADGDGSVPAGELIIFNGALLGTTVYGGADSNPVYSNSGTVYSVIP